MVASCNATSNIKKITCSAHTMRLFYLDGSQTKQHLLTCSALADCSLGTFAKLRKAIFSYIMSVHPHGTTRLPLDGFSLNLIFEYFFENLSRKFRFHYNWTRRTGALHKDRYHFLTISARFVLDWEIFQTKV